MLINPKHCALILFLIGLASAGPLERTDKSLVKGEIKCAKKCTDSKNFNYQIGRSYRYNFETKNAFTPENGNALSELKISGHAKITIQSNCEHILKLENVNIEGALKDQKDKLVKELEANNLAYSFQDGEIGGVCPMSNELKWTLNVKKAILSALQFSPKQLLTELSTSNVDEKDINGDCETTYELQTSPNANQYKVIKSKKLKTCAHRMNIDSALLGSSALASELTNAYLNLFVQSDHRCKISIKKNDGIIESVKCTQSSDGAKLIQKDLRTHHEISLKFSNEDPVHYPQLTGEFYEDSLIGEKVDLADEQENTVTSGQDLKNAIQSVCQSISNATLSYDTANKFRELVNSVKHSKYDLLKAELSNLQGKRDAALNNKHHNKVMSSSTCCPHKLFKLYLEALISAKTDASLKLLVTEIVPNNFYLQEGSVRAELKLISFYTSLAFYRKPTEETLKAALPLLKLKGRHTRNALFGVTGLARTVCKKEAKCTLPAVTELANSIADHLPANCAVKPSNENQVIESLKALENIQYLPEPVIKKMIACLTSSSASPNVKVSVIRNFENKHDQELVKKAIRDVTLNANEQDEVRIPAYKLFRKQITKENAKELEKLVASTKSELAGYIANDIKRYRDDQSITCPKILAFREATKDIDLKLSGQQGKSKVLVSYPLRPFFKSDLVVYTDVIYSGKTEKPISVTSTFKVHHREVLQIGLRSESGSNVLLNVANLETVVEGIMQLIRSINSKPEDGKSRLIDEWAARVFPELASAFKDVDLFVKVGGRNLIYISKNDQPVAIGNRLDKFKLGLAPILAMERSSDLQIHSVSGMPTLVRRDRTILSHFVLFDSQKVTDNEIKFEITPNLVLNQLVRLSYPIGKYHNEFTLENEQFLTTNFGLQGRKTEQGDKTEIRLKLSGRRVELMSHRVFNRIRQGVAVKEVATSRKNRDLCVEHVMPIRKMLGISICSQYNDDEKSIVLEKMEDSNVLITFQKEKSGASVTNKMVIEQENSPHKRRISVSMGQDEPGSRSLHVEIDNPLGKGWAKMTTSKDKLTIQAKLNDQQIYSLEADKHLEKKNTETNFKAKVSVSFPGLTKPFVSAFTAKVVNDKKFHVSGDLTINEKTRLLEYEYNVEKNNKAKRDYHGSAVKTDMDLKLFNLKGKTLFHHKYEGSYKRNGAETSHEVEYPSRTSPDKMEKLTLKHDFSLEGDDVQKMSVMSKFRSSQYPKLNFKVDHKLVYKYIKENLNHFENDINMEIDALGEGEDRKVRLAQVSTMNNWHKGSKKSSMDHLIRIVINKVHYNREISYNGNYELIKDNIYQIDDKLKVQDVSAATEVLSAAISLKPQDASGNKLKLLVDYNCNKHGKFNWNEDLTYDPKTRGLSTKIVLTVFRSDQQSPTVYNGEFSSTSDFWQPDSFDLKLRKATDNTEVLHTKYDISKPTEKMLYVDWYGKRVYDFELKMAKNKKRLDSLKWKIAGFGELDLLDNPNTPEGEKFTYKLKLDCPHGVYQQNAVLVCGKKILSLEFNITKGDNKLAQLELFLSNPKKTLITYRDVESGSILLKNQRYQASFKHDNQPTGFSSMLELQQLESKHKFVLMSVKDASKFAIMTKLEKDGNSVYALDATYSKTTPSIINYKSESQTMSLNINPFGANEDDWKILTLDITRKDGRYKHSSKINLKKLPNKKQALAVRSASSGKREHSGKSFEHSLDFQVSQDWQSLKLDAKISEDNKVDQLDYLHEYNPQEKGIGFKLNHRFKLTLQSELIFSHEMNTKLDQQDKLYEYSSNSEFKAKCPAVNGIKLNVNGNCNTKEKTGRVDLKLDYPYRNSVVVASYDAKNPLSDRFMRELKVEVSNTKLKYKDHYLAKLDLITGLELHLKFNKQSTEGHNLENLELHVLSKVDGHSLVFVAPLGWSGHVKFQPPTKDKMSFSTNLTKRGRVLLAIDSNLQIKHTNGRKRRSVHWPGDELTIHNVIGFNGNTKWAEEHIEITKDELKYKFTSVLVNVDANLKGLNNEKKNFYLKGCSAKQVTNCAVFDANIERSSKGAKSTGTFNYGLGEEAISVKFDYNRQKLDNGDNQGKLTGDVNGKQFTGELLAKKNGELSIKLNLPERVISFQKEINANGFRYVLHPNLNKDKGHEHTLSVATNKQGDKHLREIVMTHPSFKRPLKLTLEMSGRRSARVELDVANDEKKKLTLQMYKYVEGKTVKTGAIFYREDRKIDMGFSEEKMFDTDKKSTKVLIKRSQHWVDKNGKNQTLTRTEETTVESDATRSIFDVMVRAVSETQTQFFSLDGKLHLDLKQHIANGLYNWALDRKTKKRTEIDYKRPCLKVDSYDLPKEAYKNYNQINLCAMGKMSDTDLVKFEYLKPQLDAKKNLKQNEKLLMKLSKAEEQQLRMVLHWDPEMIGEWIVDTGEYVEEHQKQQAEAIATLQTELEDKYHLLRDSLVNDLILPIRKHRQEEFKAIVNEINPKLAAKLFREKRSPRMVGMHHRRAGQANQTEVSFLNFSENLAKKLFNFKLIKFSPEEGHIEFLFRAHPTFEGIKYGVRQSFEYIF